MDPFDVHRMDQGQAAARDLGVMVGQFWLGMGPEVELEGRVELAICFLEAMIPKTRGA